MIRRLAAFLAAWGLAGSLHAQELSPVHLYALTCEHLSNPAGIGNQRPRLSWKLRSNRMGETQSAWQVRASSAAEGLTAGNPDLWNSGKIISDQSVLVPWAGKPLSSRSEVFWQVRVWDKDGLPSAWSDVATFELGLLDAASEWQGKWITADLPRQDVEQSALGKSLWINAGSESGQAADIRLAITLPADAVVRRGVIDAAADGLITIYVNGHATRQGATSLTAPLHGEVGMQFSPGPNTIAIGSAPVRNAARRDRGKPGRNAIAASVFLELENGHSLEFNTGSSWKAGVNAATNWFMPGFDDSAWAHATVLAAYAEQPSKYSDNTIGPGRYLRKNFTARKPVAKARLYATALGAYEASINGQRVGDDLLAPGWTDYTKRVMAQTYDVTRLIHPGVNAIGAVLADGWYAGRVGWMGLGQYGTRPVFNAQLEITYADGSREILSTDDSWKAGPGRIVGTDAQWGEIIDARAGAKNWDQPAFEDSGWKNAIVETRQVEIDPQVGPPVRKLLELAPQSITPRGDAWIIDFGQNLVGHVRLSARGPAGAIITARHAETINADGSLYTENLRTALATDKFILGGGGAELFEPQFAVHGFRFVELTGFPGKLAAENIRAIVVGSDTPRTGIFECSDPALNRLYENIVWSQRGNFISVPTDCPQRDERMGWMGDAQVFAPTAALNAGVCAFFAKWMVDVNDGQGQRGDYADVSPRVARPQPAMPVWGDAGVIIPWVMYTTYGDKAMLEDNYDRMTRWIQFNEERSHALILSGGVGDHLAPSRTPIELVDTAYFAQSAHLLAKMAAILGKTDDAMKYNQLFTNIANAFNQAFVDTNGMLQGDTQAGYVLALQFGLLPEGLRPAAAKLLARNIERYGHLTTGFAGVGLICPALAQIRRPDLAWQLILTNTCPSWLFSVKNGATTIWERWDGWTPEHGFQDSAMNSFNHYSLGSVGAWLYSGAAGIQVDESSPGYKHFLLAPHFTRRLSRLRAAFDSPYGQIAAGWRVESDGIHYDVTIPPNSSATLMLEVSPEEVRQSGHPLKAPGGPTTRLSLVSGTYEFSLPGGAP